MPVIMLFELCILFCPHSSTAVNTSNAAGAMESADDALPSVITCANYIKLPPYLTKVLFFCLEYLSIFCLSRLRCDFFYARNIIAGSYAQEFALCYHKFKTNI